MATRPPVLRIAIASAGDASGPERNNRANAARQVAPYMAGTILLCTEPDMRPEQGFMSADTSVSRYESAPLII